MRGRHCKYDWTDYDPCTGLAIAVLEAARQDAENGDADAQAFLFGSDPEWVQAREWFRDIIEFDLEAK